MTLITNNLKKIESRIKQAEIEYERKPGLVKLLAVSKNQSIEKIKELITTGHHCFGENYIQEALYKINLLKEHTLEWHFIGRIQTNKTRAIAENFSWVQSVDNYNVAYRLNHQRSDALPPLNVCIQVNVANEPQKGGILLKDLAVLAQKIATMKQLKLRGLMIIPPEISEFNEQREIFKQLRLAKEKLCAQELKLDTLSMGMTNDLEAAIAEGATMVRIGRGIFGPR